MWFFALLLYLVFAAASGEPEPNVNVKINVNVNGESEESQESGVSCNLVWNSEEYRPLIMLRESKTIVPPVDSAISKDPNRIPIRIKLVFACPGHHNTFTHFVGNQTKLHGECVAEDDFKVCFNNSPVYLDLSRLSCRKKLFPSFLKQDNGTSDDNGCDELGGELYKQGYTYGDYHEFKDLEIDVCFREKGQNNICTSPNLPGNESDYRTTRGLLKGPIEEHPGRNPQGRTGVLSSICGYFFPVRDEAIKDITEVLLDLEWRGNSIAGLVINIPFPKNKLDTTTYLMSGPVGVFQDGPTKRPLLELQRTFLRRHRTDITEVLDQVKINNFLEAIMRTDVMKKTEEFLKKQGLIKKDEHLVDRLRVMWFTLYSRYTDPLGNKVASSCGFEHVFVGEVTLEHAGGTKWRYVKGFHNWIYYAEEEKEGRINRFIYEGAGHMLDLGRKRSILNLKFYWSGYEGTEKIGYKPKGTTLFIGTTPEFEMAVYTICFLARPNAHGLAAESIKKCKVQMDGKVFDIETSQIASNMVLSTSSTFKELVGGAHANIKGATT